MDWDSVTIPSWAIWFAASLENVAVVLSGMSNTEQMLDNTSYMEHFQPMNEEERKLVFEAAKKIQGSVAIACTACHYCTPRCPKKIAIPEYFALYNAEQNDVNIGKNRKKCCSKRLPEQQNKEDQIEPTDHCFWSYREYRKIYRKLL